MKHPLSLLILWLCALPMCAAQPAGGGKQYTLSSPDGRIVTTVSTGEQLTYDIQLDGRTVLQPSRISMTLTDGTVWGGAKARVQSVRRGSNDQMVPSPFYRHAEVRDHYQSLTLRFAGRWAVEFRAYNDGVAYRFSSLRTDSYCVASEEAALQFAPEAKATVPYVISRSDDPFYSPFENTYVTAPIRQLDADRLMFTPLSIDAGNGVKALFSESDLEDYPGMYLQRDGDLGLKAVFAPYPRQLEQGGHNNLQMIVTERENYIARIEGGARTFPWRMAIVTDDDRQLAASNLSYLLESPSRISDTSWIRPGKAAWEWWSDWNLGGVDFETGVNTATYRAYIDFAAENKLEYMLIDEGWAVNLKADLMQVVPEMDLKGLIDYANSRGVGIVLWAGYRAFERDMEQVCAHYAAMGVKGFKVDFMDRDDQPMTAFVHRAAECCARHHLLLDLHGMYKPAGLNRTWPNVLNFEGVHGLENMKWSTEEEADQVVYDVMLPFLRQASGPVDYTQGAMRNGAHEAFFPCNAEPMSQGTRCRQLALYMILDSPFCMLADTPDQYNRNPACRDFIAQVPTVWDETRVLQASMGEYIVVARRRGDTWYVGGLTNRTARDIRLDTSLLTVGQTYEVELFTDGTNAHRLGSDYRHGTLRIQGGPGSHTLHLAPGGGFAIVLRPM